MARLIFHQNIDTYQWAVILSLWGSQLEVKKAPLLGQLWLNREYGLQITEKGVIR